ncbi:MAG: nucleoside monophosphate kinase [Patescibacteria group bacterium]
MLLFMGFSGSGKDTQAGLVREVLEKKSGKNSVLWLSTGDILRGIVKNGSYAGKVVDEKVMRAGNIAPPFLATFLWADRIIKELRENQHIIFPSSPRTINEARDLDELAVFFEIKKVFPIYLNVERDEAFKRLKARGRADDTDEVINNRLNYFAKHVLPAVEYFRNESKNKLIEIDGNPNEIQFIHRQIIAAIGLK